MSGDLELKVLGLAALLAVAQLLLYAVPANLQLSSRYLAGPRDEKRELKGIPARLQRAFLNHIEGLGLFTIAVVVVALRGASSPVTEGAAVIYLAARVAYIPAYGFGIRYVRSAIWGVGMVATVVMLIAGVSA